MRWIALFLLSCHLASGAVLNFSSVRVPAPPVASVRTNIEFWVIGDSKSTSSYLDTMHAGMLNSRDTNNRTWVMIPKMATAGWSVKAVAGAITTGITARASYNPRVVKINLGANDVIGDANDVGDGVAWKTNLAFIVDAINAQWPSAQIYHTRVWRQDTNYLSKLTQINDTNLLEVITNRAFCSLGEDEREFIPRQDNGAYLMPDGLHPSTHGVEEGATYFSIKVFPQ